MVRMRDVLKSAKDVVRPGRTESLASSESEQSPQKGYSFPSRDLHSQPQMKPMQQPQKSPYDTHSYSIDRKPANDALFAREESDSHKLDLYHEGIEAIDHFLKLVQNGDNYDLTDIADISERVIESLAKDDRLFTQGLADREAVSSLAQHSINVATIAIKIAIGMKLEREKVVEVGISAMVHEVGMVKIPNEILTKKSELDASEIEIIKQHPIHGRKVLEVLKEEYPFLPEVVVQEHERWNGGGYPFGLKEDEIHTYAQILGLAVTFIALTHHRHYRDNFIAYKAIQSIIERRNKDFSAKMIKVLIDVISIFPVGSLVKLNDGSVARVKQTSKQYPIRPVIKLIQNAKGEKIEADSILDLSKEPMIYIVSPILDASSYE